MIPRPPRSTLTDTPVPYTTLCRSPPHASIRPIRHVMDDDDAGERPSAHWPRRVGIDHIALVAVDAHRFRDHSLIAHASPPPCRSCSFSTRRSEEHTSELQSLMRISYAVFCLKEKKNSYNI